MNQCGTCRFWHPARLAPGYGGCRNVDAVAPFGWLMAAIETCAGYEQPRRLSAIADGPE